MDTFGAYLKDLRIRSGRTLRAFCAESRLDPGNISRLERGRSAPPDSEVALERLAGALQLSRGSEEWQKFMDLAAAERGRIPSDLLDDAAVVEKLPVLFRTLRGTRADGDALDALVKMIRKA